MCIAYRLATIYLYSKVFRRTGAFQARAVAYLWLLAVPSSMLGAAIATTEPSSSSSDRCVDPPRIPSRLTRYAPTACEFSAFKLSLSATGPLELPEVSPLTALDMAEAYRKRKRRVWEDPLLDPLVRVPK